MDRRGVSEHTATAPYELFRSEEYIPLRNLKLSVALSVLGSALALFKPPFLLGAEASFHRNTCS